jgi:hypothetical protein
LIGLAVARLPRAAVKAVFGALVLGSLCWSAWVVYRHAPSAFYLPHLRAWELFLGVLLALRVVPPLKRYALRSAAALVGFALIVAPIFLYTENTPFPGAAALPPCLGTALLIAAGEDGRHVLTSPLSWRPVVFIGLISYSLYLWHWPIITLYQEYTGDMAIPWMRKFLLLAVSLTVATASWRFIELPFRKRVPNPAPTLAWGVGAMASVVLAGLVIVGLRGFPERFDPDVVRIASYLERPADAAPSEGKTCYLRASENRPFSDFDQERCLHVNPEQINILVFGDSHAQHLLPGVRALWPRANVMQATASGCRPLLGRGLRSTRSCVTLVNYVYRSVVTNPEIDLIVISGRWRRRDLARVERTFTALEPLASRVVIVGPTAQYDAAVPQLVALGIRFGDPNLADDHVRSEIPQLDREIRRRAERHGLSYFSAYDLFCPAGNCRQLNEAGVPYQYDYGHLTDEGSRYLATHLRENWRRNEL